jgi:hypothetical protein
MNTKARQKGLTFLSILIILAIGGFFVLLALKITPIYLENQSIKSIVAGLNDDAQRLRNKTVSGVKKEIQKRFRINSIYDFPKDGYKIKKEKNKLVIDFTYDRVEPIVHNISVMVSFSDKLEIDYSGN